MDSNTHDDSNGRLTEAQATDTNVPSTTSTGQRVQFMGKDESELAVRMGGRLLDRAGI